jgi:glucan phosphoethanolaminetransferase (alkaline phosphatase superfamily)
MTKSDEELNYECMHRFIALANEMKTEGISNRVVSAGLMTASCVFATFTTIGNSGRLNQSAMTDVIESYRMQLEWVQKQREEGDIKQEEENISQTVERIVSFPEDD